VSGRAKRVLLLALIVLVIASVWPLATGRQAAWAPGLSGSASRLAGDRYRLGERIGSGGMGEVVVARGFGRDVATPCD
jgi:hypothetical protein